MHGLGNHLHDVRLLWKYSKDHVALPDRYSWSLDNNIDIETEKLFIFLLQKSMHGIKVDTTFKQQMSRIDQLN